MRTATALCSAIPRLARRDLRERSPGSGAPPKSATASGYALSRSAALARTDHMTQHLDGEKSVVYHQDYGGGGVAVGLLLGPLGVAANMSMIEGITKRDVEQLQGKINLKPRDLFLDAAGQKGLAVSTTEDPAKARVTPYLYISKTEGDMLLASSALLVEHGTGADQWTGKYLYQLPVRYPLSQLAQITPEQTERLRVAATEGFAMLITRLGAESEDMLGKESPVKFKSELLGPRFDFEMQGNLISEDTDMAWIRTFGGVFAIRKSSVTFTDRQPAQGAAR
jgi:hypothetical protein